MAPRVCNSATNTQDDDVLVADNFSKNNFLRMVQHPTNNVWEILVRHAPCIHVSSEMSKW